METFFLHNLAGTGWIAYLVIALAMVLEGEVVLFTAIYLAEDHYLHMRYLIPILYISALAGDVLWYKVGGYMERTHPAIRHWFGRMTLPIHERLIQKPNLVIFISKFTYGLNKATLMRAGMHPVPFRTFFGTELFTLFCWMSVIGNLAWFSSASSVYLKHYVKYAEFSLLIGIVFMYICVRIFTVISRKMITNNNQKKK